MALNHSQTKKNRENILIGRSRFHSLFRLTFVEIIGSFARLQLALCGRGYERGAGTGSTWLPAPSPN